jgi:hypothetical protein
MWYGIRMAVFLSRRHFVNGGDKQDLEQAIDSLAGRLDPRLFHRAALVSARRRATPLRSSTKDRNCS